MQSPTRIRTSLAFLVLTGLLLASCSSPAAPVPATATLAPAIVPTLTLTPVPATPDWFNMTLTDVNTGLPFRMSDFAGKVVLVETMATWCPTCWKQENEVKRLQGLVSSPQDLVSVSLDVDTNENEAALKDFATTGSYTWRFAVAPILLARALSSLYGIDYLNPPLAPMLFIDRKGSVYGLPNGVKSAEALLNTLEPYLKP
jgi:hypothetical protein